MPFKPLLFLSIAFCVCSQEEGWQPATPEPSAAGDAAEEGHGNGQNGIAMTMTAPWPWQMTNDNVHQVHAELDENNDTQVSRLELNRFTEKYHQGVAIERANPMEALNKKDSSGDGFVSLDEHLSQMGLDEEAPSEDDKRRVAREVKYESAKFKAADTNNDGQLDKTEITGLVVPQTHNGVMNIVVQRSMQNADADGNGKLSWEEFKTGEAGEPTAWEGSPPRPSEQKELFSRLDKNSDGHISHDELRTLNLGRIDRENMVNAVVNVLDKDDDTVISTAELLKGKKSVLDSELQEYLMSWAKRRQILV